MTVHKQQSCLKLFTSVVSLRVTCFTLSVCSALIQCPKDHLTTSCLSPVMCTIPILFNKAHISPKGIIKLKDETLPISFIILISQFVKMEATP